MVFAGGTPGLRPGRGKHRQQEASQDANNCDHDEKFDQCETAGGQGNNRLSELRTAFINHHFCLAISHVELDHCAAEWSREVLLIYFLWIVRVRLIPRHSYQLQYK